jgi:hypothetical protein
MSTTPQRYQPEPRLIDQPDRLQELYWEDGLSANEIAEQYAEVSATRILQVFDEYGIETRSPHNGTSDGERGTDPPADEVNWSSL